MFHCMVLAYTVHVEKARRKQRRINSTHYVLCAAEVRYLSSVFASQRDSTDVSTPLKSLLPPGS